MSSSNAAGSYKKSNTSIAQPISRSTSAGPVATYSPHPAVASPVSSPIAHPNHSDLPGHTVYSVPSNTPASASFSGSSLLNHAGSQTVLHQVNTARDGMQGLNKKALPAGDVSVHPNGNLTVNAAGGRLYEVRGNGTLASYASRGQSASFRPDGRFSSLHTAGMDVRHTVNGGQTIVTRRPDQTVLVSTGRHSGYLERSVTAGNRTMIQRTYVVDHSTYTRVFTSYSYRGVVLEHYVPTYYYAPAFYGWAYYPWQAPIHYSWGWFSDPWYQSYGTYFAPYPAYPSAYTWLTDYLLGRALADAFQQREQPIEESGYREPVMGVANQRASEDAVYSPADTPITPDVKAAIAQEVQQQLSYENAASSGKQSAEVGELPSAMQPNHVFVVASSLDVTTSDQQACSLSPGDILRLSSAPEEGSPLADLRVASSKRADCPAGSHVSISLQDLQDMQNNLRANLDAGLQTLHSKQGQGGLPSAPSSGIAPPPRPLLTDAPAPPDTNVAALLETQQVQARETESSIVQMAFESQATGQ